MHVRMFLNLFLTLQTGNEWWDAYQGIKWRVLCLRMNEKIVYCICIYFHVVYVHSCTCMSVRNVNMYVDMRVIVGPRDVEVYNRGTLRHDDVLIVSDFFCREDDWDIYYRLIDEMRQSQAQGTKNADWIRFCAASGEHRFC